MEASSHPAWELSVLPLYIAERMGEVPFLHSGVHSPEKTSMKVFGGNYL
jgi:hypothetical protein